MKIKLSVFVTTLLLSVFLIGCKENSTSPAQPDKESTEATAQVHTVTIENMQFNPQELTINKGDKVIWVNKGIVVHDVSQFPDKEWTSGNIEIGDSYEMTPDEEFDYFCSIHPTMKGKIKFKD